MKSLLERARARPYHAAALVVVAIAAIALLWWLLCPHTTTSTTTKIVTNAPVVQTPLQQLDMASTTAATSEITAMDAVPVIAVNTALPKDTALAEEELDRLDDEHSRLNDRKAHLTQQLEISNKLLAMKEEQLKTLETPNQ